MDPKSDNRLRLFLGHHKCASSWVQAISREVCRELGLRFAVAYTADAFERSLPRYVEKERLDFLSYDNADYAYVSELTDFVGFHVVRDPRDICVSAYFSHLHSHPTMNWPELVEHRERLAACDKSEGLLLEMEFRQEHFNDMRSWPSGLDNVLLLKMEELTSDPYRKMLEAFAFLGLVDQTDYTARRRVFYVLTKVFRRLEHLSARRIRIPVAPGQLPAERLLGIVWDYSFQRMAGGRKRGQEDVRNHYRRGVAGDWRNHFEPHHVELFKQRYNDLLLQYGYESKEDWEVAPLPPELAG